MISRRPYILLFSLLLSLCVTVPTLAQSDEEDPDVADVSETPDAETAAPESASPEQIPLTVYIRKYEKGTTGGGSSGGGTGRDTEASLLIWTDPVQNLSLWNLNYTMVEDGVFSYGLGAALPSGLIDDPDAPSIGYGFSANANYYFSGIPYHGFFGKLSLFYSMFESENSSLEGVIGEISVGYMLEIGGPFVVGITAGADIPLTAPPRKIWFVYNSDEGNVALAAGVGLGITL